MNGLEVPDPGPGSAVERDHRVTEQVGSLPISAVEISRRRSERDKHHALLSSTLMVDQAFTPPRSSQDSSCQVSFPNSPARGTV